MFVGRGAFGRLVIAFIFSIPSTALPLPPSLQPLQIQLLYQPFNRAHARVHVFFHLFLAEMHRRPADGGEAAIAAPVAGHVAFDFRYPVFAVALQFRLFGVPIVAVPELAVDEDGDVVLEDGDVGRPRERPPVEPVAVPPPPAARCGSSAPSGRTSATSCSSMA